MTTLCLFFQWQNILFFTLQRKYRSSTYELGSPDMLSDSDNNVGKKRCIETDGNHQCSCQPDISPKNEWTYSKTSNNNCDYETILVKKRNPSVGSALWHMNTYGHYQSCPITNITPGSLVWKKLLKREKQVLFHFFPITIFCKSFGSPNLLKTCGKDFFRHKINYIFVNIQTFRRLRLLQWIVSSNIKILLYRVSQKTKTIDITYC